LPVYNLATLFEPQYVAASPAGLLWAPTVAVGGVTVPTNYSFVIGELRVANVTNAAVSLIVWRVPKGQSTGNATLVIPQINIPPATQTFPWFDVGALWGATMQFGDAVWMQAGSASALVVQGDGVIIVV